MDKVEIELESLRLMLGDLPEVASEWDKLSAEEQAAWSLDWDQLVGSWRVVLEPQHRAGQLPPEQEKRYCALLTELKVAWPTLLRLGLNTPEERSLQ